VMIPFTMASAKILIVGQPLSCNSAIVPKSPIAHPTKHHLVLCALFFQVCLQDQEIVFIKGLNGQYNGCIL